METVFNYCIQWSSVGNKEIDCFIISVGVTSYKICLSLKGMHSLWRVFESTGVNKYFEVFKSLNANPTKQSNTLKQFVCNSQRIVSVFYNFVGLLR